MTNPDVAKLPDAFSVDGNGRTSGFSSIKYPLGDGMFTFSPTKAFEAEVDPETGEAFNTSDVTILGLGKGLFFKESKNHGLTVYFTWNVTNPKTREVTKPVKVMGIINNVKGDKVHVSDEKLILKNWKKGVGEPTAPMSSAKAELKRQHLARNKRSSNGAKK